MKKSKLAIAITLASFLAGCGGGGGPTVEISDPRLVPGPGPSPSPPASSIGSVDIPMDSNGFIAAIRTVSADGKADALEAVQVFRWMNNHRNYDRAYLRDYEVDIDGVTYNLYDAYDLLQGYKNVYYDGKEGFWQDVINQGRYDDSNAQFQELQLLGMHVTNSQLLSIGRGEITLQEVKQDIIGEQPDSSLPDDEPEDEQPPADNPIVDLPENTPGTPTPNAIKDVANYRTSEFFATQSGANVDMLDTINADVAWSRGWTGNGAKIVIADTGARVSHSDLDANIVSTWNFLSNNTQVSDTIGHGTHIAGIIAAELNQSGMIGVAPDANLMIAKVSYGDGSIRFEYARQAVEWGKNNGAVATNLSIALVPDVYFKQTLVEYDDAKWYSTSDYYGKNGYGGAKAVAPEWAESMGTDMVLVKAAGNEGLAYSAGINQMATATDEEGNLILNGQMLIVGNWDIESAQLHTNSNGAGSICTTYVQNVCLDAAAIKDFYIMAPGTVIYSTDADSDNDYAHMTGTSMSAGAVSGAVAVIHQMWPHLKGKNLVQLLLTTADKTISGYNENVHGQGLLDLDAATQPSGIVGIPLTASTGGQTANLSGGISGVIPLGTVASSAMILDRYERDFYVDLSQATHTVDTRKTSFVQNQTNGHTTASFASFTGSVKKFNNLILSGYNQDNFSIAKQFGKWEFGFVNEHNSMLGNQFSGVFGLAENSQTVYSAYNTAETVSGLELVGRAELGYTTNKADNPYSLVKSVNNLVSVALHGGVFKKFNNITLGATASVPTRIISGDLALDVPVARTIDGAVISETQTADLSRGPTEIDLGLSFAYRTDRHNLGAYIEQRVNYANTNNEVLEYGIEYKMNFGTSDFVRVSQSIKELAK